MKSSADLLTEIGWLRKRIIEMNKITQELLELETQKSEQADDLISITKREKIMIRARELIASNGGKNVRG